jgi:predicted transcriptional regulator
MSNLTVRIPESLQKDIKRLSKRQHRPVSELIRECLRRYVAVQEFKEARARSIPFAQAQGFFTDEDIFEAIS